MALGLAYDLYLLTIEYERLKLSVVIVFFDLKKKKVKKKVKNKQIPIMIFRTQDVYLVYNLIFHRINLDYVIFLTYDRTNRKYRNLH